MSKKQKVDDWMVRITFAEAGRPVEGFKETGVDIKTQLALDKIMVVRSEKMDNVQEQEKGIMETLENVKQAKGEADGQLHVMILDDEPIVGKRLSPILLKAGFDVETFTDPKAALERLQTKNFDIVVTDLKMEEVDGIQVLEHIMNKCEKTRVILITGYATVEVAREALVKGAFDFIAKPFKPRDLKAVINKAALSLGHQGMLP